MDFLVRFLFIFVTLIHRVWRWVRSFVASKTVIKVPPVENPLLKISATQLAYKIRHQELSSYEVVSAYIARIKQVDGMLNAVVEDRFQDALLEAQRADDYIKKHDNPDQIKREKPLYGVPITLKESLSVKGMSLTGASTTRLGKIADVDSDSVQRIRNSGAIILLVSRTPEYSCIGETCSLAFGSTNNPYNIERSCGGSSGGEGALIGAGASVIGVGSDIAGSIKLPASTNGIFGHLPTNGCVSTEGHFPHFNKYFTHGPLTRYAEDLPLLMKILAHDAKKLKLDEHVNVSDLVINFMDDSAYTHFGFVPLQDEIRDAIKSCANLLQDQCSSAIRIRNFEYWFYCPEIMSVALSKVEFDLPLNHQDINRHALIELFWSMFGKSKISSYIMAVDLMGRLNQYKFKYYFKFYETCRKKLKAEIKDALGDDGVLLFPVFPATSYYHKELYYVWMSIQFSFIVNVFGFPSTTVPVGVDKDGMPFGIQIIANHHQDRLCFAVARKLEQLLGGWKSP